MSDLPRRVLKPVAPLLRRLARPFMVRLHRRVVHWAWETTDTRFQNVEQVATATWTELRGVQRAVPTILGAIQTEHAVNREQARNQERLAELATSVLERFQFVRNELLYELRYGARHEPEAEAVEEAKVLNPKKVEAAGENLRLNLGCGHLALPDYVNVDFRPLDGVDVVADVRDLPFEDGSVAEVFSAHLLEHFPQEELERRVLPHLVSRLRPEGTFVAVVPDAETMVREYVAGRYSFEDLREVTFGDQEYAGDFHFTMFTPAALSALLEKAGLEQVEVRTTGRRNGTCYEMEVAARRPPAGAA
jgi:SAM-dependent methyltransferase